MVNTLDGPVRMRIGDAYDWGFRFELTAFNDAAIPPAVASFDDKSGQFLELPMSRELPAGLSGLGDFQPDVVD